MQIEKRKAYLKAYMKKWRKEHAQDIKDYSKSYYKNHKQERISYVKKLRKENPDYYKRCLEGSRKYREKNKARIDNWNVKYQRSYRLKKIKEDPNYRLQWLLRARMHTSLKKTKKLTSFSKLLGTTIEEARKHIESKFLHGMSWKNHGIWHIDHILPISSFDLTVLKEQKKAFHYKNLQPLWAEDNLRKGKKMMI